MSVSAFSDVVKARVMARSGGMCEHCEVFCADTGEYHHRRNRGSGGSRDPRVGQASNCAFLCPPCHRWVTANTLAAKELGLYVSKFGTPPAEVPVWRRGQRVLLDDEGGITPAGVVA